MKKTIKHLSNRFSSLSCLQLKNCANLFSTSTHCCTNKQLDVDSPSVGKSQIMREQYQFRKNRIYNKFEHLSIINPRSVFAVNQINLNDIKVYGFDYDYTLAQYADAMQDFIHTKALNILVKKHHFPKALLSLTYDPGFCIRGLHYDISKCLLMKVDICNVVQLGTVYRGLNKLNDSEVNEVFDGSRHIPKHVIDQSYTGGESLKQLMDIFSMPEMMLLANVVDFFDKQNISFDPRILFENVQNAVREVHVSGLLYDEVCKNVDKFLQKNSLCELINHLTSAQKKLFLITNSNFHFVDTGMRHLVGSDWQDAFDVVIVQAKKPHFFKTKLRPFKTLIPDTSEVEISWNQISELRKGVVYCEGCLYELMKLSKWEGTEILYFGDQIYADLSDLTYGHGWRTGAIIPELENEIEVMNSRTFGRSVLWIQTLEHLLEQMQVILLLFNRLIRLKKKVVFSPYYKCFSVIYCRKQFFKQNFFNPQLIAKKRKLIRLADIFSKDLFAVPRQVVIC